MKILVEQLQEAAARRRHDGAAARFALEHGTDAEEVAGFAHFRRWAWLALQGPEGAKVPGSAPSALGDHLQVWDDSAAGARYAEKYSSLRDRYPPFERPRPSNAPNPASPPPAPQRGAAGAGAGAVHVGAGHGHRRHAACRLHAARRDEKWLATVPIFLVHLAIMGTTVPASLLMARSAGGPASRLARCWDRAPASSAALALYQQSFPLLCLAAVLQGMQAAFFWYFRPGRGRRLRAGLPRQGHLPGHGGRRAGRLARPADREVGGRLAGARDVCRHLPGHGLFSIAIGILVQFIRIPRLSAAERAAGGRPNDADRAPTRLSRGAGLLGVRLRGHDAHHVGDAAGHAGLWLHVQRQRHRDPGAHRRHVPAVVLDGPSDRSASASCASSLPVA